MASLPQSARLLRALILAACVFPAVQACGGRSDTEDYLFDGDGTISVGASSSSAGRNSTAGTRPGGGSNGSGGAGVAGGGPTPTGGVSVGGSRPLPVAGTTGVGGTGAGGTGVGGSGTAGTPAGGASGTAITCGAQVCDSATQSCCAAFGGLTCVGRNQDCAGAVLGCTVNADCAGGGVCCISITGDIDAASSCKARCDNIGTGRDRQLCQTADECLDPFRYCTATIFGVNICTRRP
jgi:hypothetical protein